MKELVIVIVKYLKQELNSKKLSPDVAEGVEVAIQCLENAYDIFPRDVERCTLALEDLYLAASFSPKEGRVITEEQKEEAESLKLLGNKLMREGSYIEAIGHYTRAIELDPKNSVYFCNRAAAHIQTQNFLAAINDCHESIQLDPNYSKAHSRLGYAYQAVGNRAKARDCYAKALDIEPENEGYRNCFQKLVDQGPANTPPVSQLMGLLPGIDIGAIMKNPSFVQMASQMLEDPGMQNFVTKILSGQSSFPAGQVEELITAGQQLADRLQNEIDKKEQEKKDGSNGHQSQDEYENPDQVGQEPGWGSSSGAMDQEPTTSARVQPQQANIASGSTSISPQDAVGLDVEGASSSGVKGKNGKGPNDVDMGSENANQ